MFLTYIYTICVEMVGDRESSIKVSLSNPMTYIPKIMFFTKGRGTHKDYLTSFELALRDASISDLNLVSVSSIKPPQCKIVTQLLWRAFP